MRRKAEGNGQKRSDIIAAAFELFFTKGFDGTTVRSIMRKAGGEIGLFYYYFENKNDVFDKVLDYFFSKYEEGFGDIVAQGRRNPCRLMYNFFIYMETETIKFREQYAQHIHRTVRWAIREHTLEIIEPYIRQVVDIQSAYYGIEPALDPEAVTMYLTYGVGSSILHERAEQYRKTQEDMQRGTSLIMNMPKEEQEFRIPYQAEEQDVEGWLEMAEAVREYFPGFDAGELEAELRKRIRLGEAWLYRYQGKIVAGALYSKENQTLDYLAVAAKYRRKGMAHRLVETVAAQFPIGTELSVTTFREEDERGAFARAFYKSLGFEEAELVEEFGYPCQRLVLCVPERV